MDNWQDIVLAIGALIFTIALIPSIKGKDKPALLTSVVTAGVLAVFAITYFTLSLWYASFTAVLSSVAWSILAIQRYLQVKNDQK